MALDSQQVGWLLNMIVETHDAELSCPQCGEILDQYAQRILDGEPIDGLMVLVKEHLQACSGCNDQYQMILDALQAIESDAE
ncbi:MAG: hypothetical protein AAFU85_00065 [Planctomycetota bacterium]